MKKEHDLTRLRKRKYNILFSSTLASVRQSLTAKVFDLKGKANSEGIIDTTVTHVVADKLCRTEKQLSAMVAGIPILKTSFITESAAAGQWLDEVSYLFDPDVLENEGEKQIAGRVRADFHRQRSSTEKLPPLFQSWKVAFCCGSTESNVNADKTYKRLIELGGGRVVKLSDRQRLLSVPMPVTHVVVMRKEDLGQRIFSRILGTIPVLTFELLASHIILHRDPMELSLEHFLGDEDPQSSSSNSSPASSQCTAESFRNSQDSSLSFGCNGSDAESSFSRKTSSAVPASATGSSTSAIVVKQEPVVKEEPMECSSDNVSCSNWQDERDDENSTSSVEFLGRITKDQDDDCMVIASIPFSSYTADVEYSTLPMRIGEQHVSVVSHDGDSTGKYIDNYEADMWELPCVHVGEAVEAVKTCRFDSPSRKSGGDLTNSQEAVIYQKTIVNPGNSADGNSASSLHASCSHSQSLEGDASNDAFSTQLGEGKAIGDALSPSDASVGCSSSMDVADILEGIQNPLVKQLSILILQAKARRTTAVFKKQVTAIDLSWFAQPLFKLVLRRTVEKADNDAWSSMHTVRFLPSNVCGILEGILEEGPCHYPQAMNALRQQFLTDNVVVPPKLVNTMWRHMLSCCDEPIENFEVRMALSDILKGTPPCNRVMRQYWLQCLTYDDRFCLGDEETNSAGAKSRGRKGVAEAQNATTLHDFVVRMLKRICEEVETGNVTLALQRRISIMEFLADVLILDFWFYLFEKKRPSGKGRKVALTGRFAKPLVSSVFWIPERHTHWDRQPPDVEYLDIFCTLLVKLSNLRSTYDPVARFDECVCQLLGLYSECARLVHAAWKQDPLSSMDALSLQAKELARTVAEALATCNKFALGKLLGLLRLPWLRHLVIQRLLQMHPEDAGSLPAFDASEGSASDNQSKHDRSLKVDRESNQMQQDKSSASGGDLSIAWRYENLRKVDASASSVSQKVPLHNFDLSTQLSSERISVADISTFFADEHSGANCYHTLLTQLQKMLSRSEFRAQNTPVSPPSANSTTTAKEVPPKKKVIRLALHKFGGAFWGSEADLIKFFFLLRCMVRQCHTCCVVTISAALLEQQTLSDLRRISDIVVRLDSFTGATGAQERANNAAIEQYSRDYDGFVQLVKPCTVNTLVPYIPESLSMGYRLKRRKFIIEKLHLPPDLSETVSRVQTDSAVMDCASNLARAKLDF